MPAAIFTDGLCLPASSVVFFSALWELVAIQLLKDVRLDRFLYTPPLHLPPCLSLISADNCLLSYVSSTGKCPLISVMLGSVFICEQECPPRLQTILHHCTSCGCSGLLVLVYLKLLSSFLWEQCSYN